MKIQVTKKNQYGRERVFPVDTDAKFFAELIGKETFQPWHLNHIAALGFEVEYVDQTSAHGLR